MNIKLKNKLRRMINKYDPIGIYQGKNINFDEYDPEINEIFSEFRKCKNINEFTDKVYKIFQKWFSKKVAGPKFKYKKMTKEIYIVLRKNFAIN